MIAKAPPLFPKVILSFVIAVVLINPVPARSASQSSPAAATDTACRFGITSTTDNTGYDVASLGVGSYLDWGAVTNPSLPNGVEYIRVLRLRDDVYPQTLADLPSWVLSNPGSVWIVGNEPDTFYGEQDALFPEVYADRYFELATLIRHLDPAAQIGFGPIVQPTPIRIRYLQRAWNRLIADAGNVSQASSLIDIWSIHSFILNEQCSNWGTGIPPGFSCGDPDAVVINDFANTYSIDIFQQRITAFRSWMATIGERHKPLWITEYGSLLPPIDPPGGPDYINVSDENTAAYMLATFDFMLSASDPLTGLPEDGNQLVQRWYWYSLNDYRYHFGGTLFDPDNNKLPTHVGEEFINYQASHLVDQPDLFPASLTISPLSYNPDRTLVNYLLSISIDNNQFYDASCAQLWVYDGDPDHGGTLIAGPLPASAFHADAGVAQVFVRWLDVLPFTQHYIYVHVEPVGISDYDVNNNWAVFPVLTDELPQLNFLSVIQR